MMFKSRKLNCSSGKYSKIELCHHNIEVAIFLTFKVVRNLEQGFSTFW